MRKALTTRSGLNRLTRHLTIRLAFQPSLLIKESYFDMDEDDITAVLEHSAAASGEHLTTGADMSTEDRDPLQPVWHTYVERANAISTMILSMQRLSSVYIIFDMNLEKRTRYQLLEFHGTVSRIVASLKEQNISSIHISISERSCLHDHMFLSPIIANLAPKIRTFDIGDAQAWAHEGVHDLFKAVGPLKRLLLKGIQHISYEFLDLIRDFHGSALEELTLANVRRFDDEYALNEVIPKCSKLQSLNLKGSIRTWVRNESSYPSFQGCRLLKHLNVSMCTRLPTSFFKTIASSCPLLTSLDASETCLDDDTLTSILDGCQKLQQLHIRTCSNLTTKSLVHLVNHPHSNLVSLDVCGNYKLVEDAKSPLAVLRMIRSCPAIRELHVGPVIRGRAGARDWAVLSNLDTLTKKDDYGAWSAPDDDDVISPFTAFSTSESSFRGSTDGYVGTSLLFCDRYMTLDMKNVGRYLSSPKIGPDALWQEVGARILEMGKQSCVDM
ncbi:hypothetical protein HDV05_004993 [Chytridiales sp. JEL 0842]|nr:hypothetical protein HDV05_004993 [Chytridiales sp. JEL 0842]